MSEETIMIHCGVAVNDPDAALETLAKKAAHFALKHQRISAPLRCTKVTIYSDDSHYISPHPFVAVGYFEVERP